MESGDTGFVKRGNQLVYAVLFDDRVYLLDILGHGDFANDHLVRVMATNWPNDRLAIKLNGVLPGEPPTMDEIRDMRSKGFDSIINIDGQPYMSGLTGGLTRAGTSSRNAMEIIWFF
jgi:hypothetical protein